MVLLLSVMVSMGSRADPTPAARFAQRMCSMRNIARSDQALIFATGLDVSAAGEILQGPNARTLISHSESPRPPCRFNVTDELLINSLKTAFVWKRRHSSVGLERLICNQKYHFLRLVRIFGLNRAGAL